MQFRLLRNGVVDGVPTQQDITASMQRHEWSDERRWKPETPCYLVPMVLKCVKIDTDGDHRVSYFVAIYLHEEWREANTRARIELDLYSEVSWKLI